MTVDKEAIIQSAIEDGIQTYFDTCRNRIPSLVNTHYHYPGCWRLNQLAFGWDMIKAPLNLLWAPLYILTTLVINLLGKLGLPGTALLSQRLPGGMTTNVQKQVTALIRRELLQVPDNTEGSALGHAIVQQLESVMIAQSNIKLSAAETAQLETKLEHIIDDALNQLKLTRTASADISNTVFSTAIGAFAFSKFTPGGLGIGLVAATIWASYQAKASFIFGESLGAWYYYVFPPTPSITQITLSIIGVLCLLSVIASFSGLVTDPLQAYCGLHHRRMRVMLKRLEQDTLSNSRGSFRPLDPYIARILEVFDTLKASLH